MGQFVGRYFFGDYPATFPFCVVWMGRLRRKLGRSCTENGVAEEGREVGLAIPVGKVALCDKPWIIKSKRIGLPLDLDTEIIIPPIQLNRGRSAQVQGFVAYR